VENDQLLHLIREVVINGEERFKKKKNDDFATKLNTSISDALSLQEKNEKIINDMLKDVNKITDQFISRKVLRLACPLLYDEDDGWNSDTSVFIVISHAHPYDKLEWEQLATFIENNASAAKASIGAILDEMSSIKQSAEAMKWPASDWMKYTQWSYVVRNVQSYISNIKSLLGEK